MVTRVLFVEGGGDHHPQLESNLRKAFIKLLDRAGVMRKPRVQACGGRDHAYKAFRNAVADNDFAPFLLVDSEAAVNGVNLDPWDHVKARDGWERPERAESHQLHLMATCMETWLVADPDSLRRRKKNFDADALPGQADLESVSSAKLQAALTKALKGTKTPKYEKSMAFDLLEHVDPTQIELRCPTWGKRFLLAAKSWT